MITKHRYTVNGLTSEGTPFCSTCIGLDMIEVIQNYQKLGYYPHRIIQREQVHRNARLGVELLF